MQYKPSCAVYKFIIFILADSYGPPSIRNMLLFVTFYWTCKTLIRKKISILAFRFSLKVITYPMIVLSSDTFSWVQVMYLLTDSSNNVREILCSKSAILPENFHLVNSLKMTESSP